MYTFKLSRYFSDWSAIKRRIERESWHWMPAWCGHICFANNKSSLSFAEIESDYRVHHITISLWNVIHFYLTIRVTSYTQWLFIFSAHANHSSHFNLIQSKVQFAIAMNLNWGWTHTHTKGSERRIYKPLGRWLNSFQLIRWEASERMDWPSEGEGDRVHLPLLCLSKWPSHCKLLKHILTCFFASN